MSKEVNCNCERKHKGCKKCKHAYSYEAHKISACEIESKVVNADTINVRGDLTVNGGLCVLGAVCAKFDKDNLEFTVPANVNVKRHDISITRKPKAVASIPLGMSDAPLSPNPLVTDDAYLFGSDYMIVTPAAGGPWYFTDLLADPKTKAPIDAAGTRVLYCGIPESFLGGAGAPGGPNPPFDDDVSVANIISSNPDYVVNFTLPVRYSSEPAYDFLTIKKNTFQLFKDAGAGPDINNPFRTGEIQVSLRAGDVLNINFAKDGAYYAGVDTVYLYIKDLVISNPLTVTSKLVVYRDSVKVLDFSNAIDIDNESGSLIVKDFEFLAGDVIKLEYDPIAYDDISINLISAF